MGKLDQYFEQAKDLPADRKTMLEHMLAEFFTPANWELSPKQEAELERRMADPNRTYTPWEEVKKSLGWSD